jgi:hypothetical protein
MKKKGGYKKKYAYKKTKNASYYKRKYAKKKSYRKKKYGQNKGARANLLVPVRYRQLGYRPFIKAVGEYWFSGPLTLNAGLYTPIVFSGNSPWDPYYAAGGVSCLNWTDISTLGRSYYCYASSISVRVLPTYQTQSNDTTVYVIASKDQTLSIASTGDLMVQCRTSPNIRSQAVRSLGDPNKNYTLWMKRATKTMLPMANPSDLKAPSMTNNPTVQFKYIVGAVDDVGAVDTTAAVRIQVHVRYYCIVYNEPSIAL